ncbi:MAG TPA: hypothetical protein VIU16_02875 [Gaiellaceae bacterium]
MKTPRGLEVRVFPDADGCVGAHVPAHPGCRTQAPDWRRLEARVRAALSLWRADAATVPLAFVAVEAP